MVIEVFRKRRITQKRTFVLFILCYNSAVPRPARFRRKPHPPPRRQPRGQRTREAILRRAVNLASVEGLEGLTVGRLADDLKMSKSGLFAHFGSKEELQLATVETARQIFIDQITFPALKAPKGLPRLWNLIDSWLGHVEGKIYAGGCFFTAASFEFDDRRGLVRDRIAAIMREWMAALERAVFEAQKAGHIEAKTNSTLLAHEVQGIGLGAHWAHQLLDDPVAYSRARDNIRERLASLATPSAPPLPPTGAAKAAFNSKRQS
jgi:AcrR family transcriptional regulator